MSEESVSQRFCKRDSLVSRTIAGQTLVVPVSKNAADLDSVYVLSPVAARIWELLDEKPPVDAIIETITGEFEVSREDAARDVMDFLNGLSAQELIRSA